MGGGSQKSYLKGGLSYKGAWTIFRFKKGLGEKEGAVFLRGLIPQCTLFGL